MNNLRKFVNKIKYKYELAEEKSVQVYFALTLVFAYWGNFVFTKYNSVIHEEVLVNIPSNKPRLIIILFSVSDLNQFNSI